jgi:hypothetical protein
MDTDKYLQNDLAELVEIWHTIQGVFEIEAFLLTCDSMRCSKEF